MMYRWWVVLAASALVVACGDGDGGTGTSGSGAGASGAGGSGGSASGGGGSELQGYGIVVASNAVTTSSEDSFIQAIFYIEDGSGPDCSTVQEGPCRVRVCEGSSTQSAGSPANAGEVTVTGASTVTLTPDALGTYDQEMQSGVFFQPGETVSFDIAGDEVPAMSGEVIGASHVTMTLPVIDSGTLAISASADLDVAWTGGTVAEVLLLLSFTGAENAGVAECSFAASDGMGTIPSAALSLLPMGEGGLTMLARSSEDVENDGFVVRLSASHVGQAGDGIAVTAANLTP